MEAIGDILAPYSETLAKFAGTVTCLQFLSAIFLLNDIRKKNTSDNYAPDPFLGGIVLSILSLKLGMIMGDAAMINVNLIGILINVVFMGVFYGYASAEARTKIWSKFGVCGLFIMAFFIYTNLENPANLEFRCGMIITTILVMLVGSPLLNLGKIMETKSTEGLPFPLILSGTVVAASWMFYGLSIHNAVVTYQNMFLLLLSSIQLSLFVIYPTNPAKTTKAE